MRDIRALAARHIAQRYIAALTALERKLRQAWTTVQQSRIEFRSITEEINTRVQVLRTHLSFFRAHSVKALRFELPCKIAADCQKSSKARRRSGSSGWRAVRGAGGGMKNDKLPALFQRI
jgi:hypothetical protein